MKPIPYIGSYLLFTITHDGQETREGARRQMAESIIFTKAKAFTSLCDDCTELIKLLTSSVKTAKAKSQSQGTII